MILTGPEITTAAGDGRLRIQRVLARAAWERGSQATSVPFQSRWRKCRSDGRVEGARD